MQDHGATEISEHFPDKAFLRMVGHGEIIPLLPDVVALLDPATGAAAKRRMPSGDITAGVIG